MDTATDIFARSANGHTWTIVLILQANCTACGKGFLLDQAKAGEIPRCEGRRAAKEFGGHWLVYGLDERGEHAAACKLCDEAFGFFVPAVGDGRHSLVGIGTPVTLETRPLPACRKCDHRGALKPMASGKGWNADSRHYREECSACQMRRMIVRNEAE